MQRMIEALPEIWVKIRPPNTREGEGMKRISDVKYMPTDFDPYTRKDGRTWGIPDLTEEEAADLAVMPERIVVLEQERDRLKKTMAILDGNLTAAMKEIMGRNIELLKVKDRLQARDSALEKVKEALNKIGPMESYEWHSEAIAEAIHAIEAVK